MTPRRIVLVMIEAPLPFGNAAGRWYHVLLRGLVERGHSVTAFAACSKAGDVEEARALYPSPAFDLRLFPFPRRGPLERLETLIRPFSYMFSGELKRDLAETLARGFDVLHLEQIWSGWLARRYTSRTLLNVHYLLDIDWVERPSTTPVRWKDRSLGLWAERRLVRSYHYLRACTPRLVEPLQRLNPRAEVCVVPFGLDVSLYDFIPDESRPLELLVTLIGSMNWGPSHSAAVRLLTRLWPEIRRRVPAARLRIVGWKARSALSAFLDIDGVEIIEDVADSRPFFRDSGVFLYAPGRGCGMKIKIQEAMAYGVPVVTTSEGVEGLPALEYVHAGIADDDAGLIDRTVRLLEEKDLQNSLRKAARELIETHCDPVATVASIEALHSRIIANATDRDDRVAARARVRL
jgi:glycosyltransferase involved in cell wall biosynthesis